REPARVRRDLADELITGREAREVYGVVVAADGHLDEAATSSLRKGKRRGQDGPAFVHGPERQKHEAIWPIAASKALAETVLMSPSGLRRALMQRVRSAFAKASSPITADEVRAEVQRAHAALVQSSQGADPGLRFHA